MRSIVTNSILALSLVSLLAGASACGKDASCANVVDHTMKLMPKELASAMGDKKEAIAKCEKSSTPEQRECAMKAEKLADLMKCAPKDKTP